MAEPTRPPLSESDIEVLVTALEIWAERHPAPDAPLLSFAGSDVLTARGLADEVRQRTADGEAFLRMVQFGLESATFSEILASFGLGATAAGV